jgi:hypothetical protein
MGLRSFTSGARKERNAPQFAGFQKISFRKTVFAWQIHGQQTCDFSAVPDSAEIPPIISLHRYLALLPGCKKFHEAA